MRIGLISPSYLFSSNISDFKHIYANTHELEERIVGPADKVVIVDSYSGCKDALRWKKKYPDKDFVGLSLNLFEYFNLRDYLKENKIFSNQIILDAMGINSWFDFENSNYNLKKLFSEGVKIKVNDKKDFWSVNKLTKTEILSGLSVDKTEFYQRMLVLSTFEPESIDDLLPSNIDSILLVESDLLYWGAFSPNTSCEERIRLIKDYIKIFNTNHILINLFKLENEDRITLVDEHKDEMISYAKENDSLIIIK